MWERFGEVKVFVEPFFGSGAVLLGAPWPADRIETVNDKDGFVANFWRAVKHDPDQVAHYADWPVNECLPSGTMITTPDGEIPIETIRPGMIVYGERAGSIMPTVVEAIHQGVTRELYSINDLFLTGNHPVWTKEFGYVEARRFSNGLHVKKLDWPIDKNDLDMLSFRHEESTVGNICFERSPNLASSICWDNVSGQGEIQGAHFKGNRGRIYPSRLLDSITYCQRIEARLFHYRSWLRARMAGARKILDCLLSSKWKYSQSLRWGRGLAGLCADAGVAGKMVTNAAGCALYSRTHPCNAWQETYRGSDREDSDCQHRSEDAGIHAARVIRISQGPSRSDRAAITDGTISARHNPHIRVSAERKRFATWKAVAVRGNRNGIYLSPASRSRYWRNQGRSSICIEAIASVQRTHLQAPIVVYNFQTSTGNYFANRILVHNCDLHARHSWLVAQKADLVPRLEGDPDFYDPKIAGWWVWGMACWIGDGFCSGNGPWHVEDGKLIKTAGDAGQGVNRKRVHLGGAGRGDPGTGECGLYAWMQTLSDRLARVRVCCGDWARVCGHTPTTSHGLTGVFLDPPYSAEAGRNEGIYPEEDMSIAHDVRRWAIEHGPDPKMRIALCGYAEEHGDEMQAAGWIVVPWQAQGGYGNQGNGSGRTNRLREAVWFSPHCLAPVAEIGSAGTNVQDGLFEAEREGVE